MNNVKEKLQVEIWSDVMCPWCAVGYTSFAKAVASLEGELAVEARFMPFELNPDFEWAAMEAGFPVVARGAEGEVRAIESPTHRFFLATLFQPQLSSTEKKPHPIVLAFVQAAADWGKKKLDDSVLE